LQAADAVHPQAAKVLECLHRGTGAVAEHTIVVDGPTATESGGQPALNVGDGRAGVPR
jgi:hypothetical protein